jgi:hypothetical protein
MVNYIATTHGVSRKIETERPVNKRIIANALMEA